MSETWAAMMAQLDWSKDGPWLALLLLLVGGIALPAGLYALLDRWAASRLRIDSIALATRYGGYMNSWAVFGRHASEYRDLRPLFPEAQAAELARFHDGTACIAARFRTHDAAEAAAEQRFGSFASAGVEYADAGVSFKTGPVAGSEKKGYARGQWLVIGDTLFAFYGPDSQALARRRHAIPALRARRFPGPLRLLHSRIGHGVAVLLWLGLLLFVAGRCLELTAMRPGAGAPVTMTELRMRLGALNAGGQRAATELRPGGMTIARHGDDLRQHDLGLLAGRDWLIGLDLTFDRERNTVKALPLVGRSGAAERIGAALPPPKRWRNNTLLVEADDPLVLAVRDAVTEAGWTWQPVLVPALPVALWQPGWAWLGFGG
ncbi:MAG: hypothetical protein OJJ21_03485 [Ferrovibrio sp.]|uniref:hypothetical protein n=1 Tax=Ferrovibrio sp. TaxID=1917215 RepID=UPI00262A638D|nr:hypothetical protein [Ferrovibrio sp.]MCW0232641.1 hypothetical protein [Ferrovibrio sp.]